MTVPRWDANRWQQEWRLKHAPAPRRTGRLKGALVLGGTIALLAMAAAANANFGASADDRVAICHATGDPSGRFVFLRASEDGYEHAHHRHHEGDFFPADPAQGCIGDPIPPAGNATDNGTVTDNGTAPDGAGADGNGTAAEGNATDGTADGNDPAADNATSPDGAGNGTAGNGTDEATAGEDADNATAPPAGDARLRQTAWQDDQEVGLTLEVRALGPGVSRDVALSDALPEVRRTWYLGGPDASDCVLAGRELSCWFGDMEPGETVTVTLRAYTDRMPCGFSLTNTATITSPGDAEPRNDAASAGIMARPC
jgi:hypothetical protein